MATWKKVIVSGSNASLADVSASGGFIGDGSAITNLGTLGNALTVDNSTIRVNSGTTYDGSAARTISVKPGGIVEASLANDAVTADKLASNAVVNASVAANAAIAHSKLAALASTKVLVGNGSNVATEVPLSGDVTMANTGAVTIGDGKVVNAMLGDGAVDTEEIADDAVDADKLASNAVVNASIAANAAIAHSKLAALAATKVLVGNGSNVAAEVPLSGDVTMNNAGAVTIGANKVTLAKMAGLARGKIISGDSSGDPVALAAGGANTVLQSDGTDITYNTVATAMIADDAVDADKLASNAVVNASVADGAAIAFAKLAALPNRNILVGNGSNVATAVAMSGAITLANDGEVALANNAVTLAAMAGLARGKIISGDSSGDPVALAAGGANTVLQSDGTDITYGTVATAMIANDAVDADKLASNAVVNASIAANAAIAHSKLAALASTKVLVGNGSNVAAEVPLSGDVTMDNAGAVTIADNAVTIAKMAGLARGKIISGDSSGDPVALAAGDANTVLQSDGTDITYGTVATAMIANDAVDADKLASNAVVNASVAANAAIAHSKLAALAATKVLVGNGSNVAAEVPLSGDVTMANTGAVTIANNAVDGDKLADSIVIAADLTVTGDLLVSGDSVTVNTANLNVEDPFILLKSGSSNTSDSGIIFGGSTGTANTGKAIVWDASYNSNDGRLAVSTAAVAGDATANFGAGTTGYYVAGAFLGSAANAATALADHAGNIRIESSEIYIYV